MAVIMIVVVMAMPVIMRVIVVVVMMVPRLFQPTQPSAEMITQATISNV